MNYNRLTMTLKPGETVRRTSESEPKPENASRWRLAEARERQGTDRPRRWEEQSFPAQDRGE